MRFVFDGRPVEFRAGDSLLIALLRAGLRPIGGGCLCLGGDCPHCLGTVDGVAYVRTCQVLARPGQVIQSHPADGNPPLPVDSGGPEVHARNMHCDVVVVGQGATGRAAAAAAIGAGKQVVTLDVADGQEVIGIYTGPLVVARTLAGMLHVHAREEVVVATGAAEIQPVVPGNQLSGIVTARAAARLAAAGVDLGRIVAVGTPPEGVDAPKGAAAPEGAGTPVDVGAPEGAGTAVGVRAQVVDGQLVRFEGATRVEAVVVRGRDGQEQRLPCDTVSVGLGFHPRDALLRMSNGLAVRAVGRAARDSDIPACPVSGTVCSCSGVSVDDLQAAWDRGFHEMELIKRATLAGTGTCQGGVCLPHLRSFLADRGAVLQPAFTARPVTRQLTLGEVAAGAYHHATPRTSLDAEHRRLGARMDRVGGWWRPWTYGNFLEEYWAVREGVSLGDVSTLGKMLVSGPGAVELLERLYPTRVSTIAPGRSRYVLLLNERGYVLDDGLISRDSETRFALTFTSGGASFAEMWVRDWAESWKLDVRILNQTMSLGAINVTGPLASELLARAGLDRPLGYMHHRQTTVAGVPCRVYRLSFTGELSYELHHPAAHSVRLWRRLLELGAHLGIRPHGLDTLLKLRLEKGHVIVGQDTDFDSTPRRLALEGAARLDKPDFVGRAAVLRTNKLPLDRQLVGLEMEGPAPIEGALLWHGLEYAGYVTSSLLSPALGKVVMLGWLKLFDGELPAEVTIDGRPARRVPLPFYDKDGQRARA